MTGQAVPVGDVPFHSLYRRFRPQRFSEVRGQEHVTRALHNAVRDERVAHAYLFSGPRGTGKTSTARILAKALNCTALEDGEPCGTCASCEAIARGVSFDVHEIDAASHNHVDEMRDLIARASLATPGRWKVYIVDEVHMLSTAASNALLKTLEEPPEGVVFVLATTDPQKVLRTIRSRTQQYDFHLIDDRVLAELVTDVAGEAGLALPEGAALQAVRKGRGSARDALSVLDQVAAAGVVDEDSGSLAHVVRALADEDGPGALVALDAAVRLGRDPQQLAVDLVETLRAGFLSLAGAGAVADGLARFSSEELDVLRSLGLPRCVRGMELIGAAIVAMRDAPEPRITLEVAVYRAAVLEGDTSAGALLERVERLERRIEQLSSSPSTGQRPPPSPDHPSPQPAVPPSGSSTPERSAPTPAPAQTPTPPPSAVPGARPALGAFRRPASGAGPLRAGSPETTEGASPTPARAADPVGTPDPPVDPEPVLTPDPPVAARRTEDVVPSDVPDRDAFVLAWGDAVLTGLRPRTRMLYNVGHFVAAENGTGVFALPNAFHVQMAEPHREEVAEALSAHLGVRVGVRLTVEDRPSPRGGDAPRSAGGAEPSEHPAAEPESLDDVGDPVEEGAEPAATGAEWAADALRAAFPGAEEITT